MPAGFRSVEGVPFLGFRCLRVAQTSVVSNRDKPLACCIPHSIHQCLLKNGKVGYSFWCLYERKGVGLFWNTDGSLFASVSERNVPVLGAGVPFLLPLCVRRFRKVSSRTDFPSEMGRKKHPEQVCYLGVQMQRGGTRIRF